MRFLHILTKATATPWFITEPALASIRDALQARLNSDAAIPTAALVDETKDAEKPDPLRVPTGVAIIEVHGPLAKGVSSLQAMCGMCDYDSIVNAYASAVNDPKVQAVVMHFDSPGGTSNGCTEAFEAINQTRRTTEKPLLAFTDQTMASAAYYLASACDSISSTVTACVGSIGCIFKLFNYAERMREDKVQHIVIKSGRMKDLGNAYREISEEEMQVMQGQCDYFFDLFARDVSTQRPQVDEVCYETALFYYGTEAADMGLVDEISPSFQVFLDDLGAALNPADRRSI